MWEAIEYASMLTYPAALAEARRKNNDVQVKALLVGENKNLILMRMVRSCLLFACQA